MTISDSPVTAVIAADLADTSIPLHLMCKNGLAGSSCVVAVTNSKMVLVDCTGAKSCKVDIQKG
jgi:ferredoxin